METGTRLIIGLGLLGVAGGAYWYYRKSIGTLPIPNQLTTPSTGTPQTRARLNPASLNTNQPAPTGVIPNSQGGIGGSTVEVKSGDKVADVEVTLKNIGTLYTSGQIDRQKVQDLISPLIGKRVVSTSAYTPLYSQNIYGVPVIVKETDKGVVLGKIARVGFFYDGQEPTLTINVDSPFNAQKVTAANEPEKTVLLKEVDVKASSVNLI